MAITSICFAVSVEAGPAPVASGPLGIDTARRAVSYAFRPAPAAPLVERRNTKHDSPATSAAAEIIEIKHSEAILIRGYQIREQGRSYYKEGVLGTCDFYTVTKVSAGWIFTPNYDGDRCCKNSDCRSNICDDSTCVAALGVPEGPQSAINEMTLEELLANKDKLTHTQIKAWFAQDNSDNSRGRRDICENKCKELGTYPICNDCPNFVAPVSTPGVMTWEELVVHMDNLSKWDNDAIRGWRSLSKA